MNTENIARYTFAVYTKNAKLFTIGFTSSGVTYYDEDDQIVQYMTGDFFNSLDVACIYVVDTHTKTTMLIRGSEEDIPTLD